jgi:hypothetical protein
MEIYSRLSQRGEGMTKDLDKAANHSRRGVAKKPKPFATPLWLVQALSHGHKGGNKLHANTHCYFIDMFEGLQRIVSGS